MSTVRIYAVIPKRVLVTRESARQLAPELKSAVGQGGEELVLDFSQVDGLTPSFLDELLAVVEETLAADARKALAISVVNAPTRLSAKFEAVARAHALVAREMNSGTWMLTRSE